MQRCGLLLYSTKEPALNSLDLDQSVQQLSLPVQQYEHVVVEPRGHCTVLRLPWLAGGSLAFLGRYTTTLQCTGQQARHRSIRSSFIQCPCLTCQMVQGPLVRHRTSFVMTAWLGTSTHASPTCTCEVPHVKHCTQMGSTKQSWSGTGLALS
jgi:hypothetical protein